MSLKRFHIEQLCPSIASMISLHHYVIVNLNFHENHVQYVHRKTDDLPRVTQYTVQELSKALETGKISLKINLKHHSTLAWNDV